MAAARQLHLGAFMRPVGIHTAWWRYPGAWPDANFNLKHLVRFAQKLEAGRFDAFFMADHLSVLNMPMAALKRSATVTYFDPLTLFPALAMMTEHLGLIATASTTFEPPYLIARRFASLDHISGGRAAWNLVTTSNPDSALNFGLTEHMEHGERYRRAREFYDVVTGLWDSWADDAFVRDVEEGLYFDPARLHVLDHEGEFLSVRGPLNIARPIQGWPVIVQAGASEAGRQLAAETAEAVFTAQSSLAVGREFYADGKGRALTGSHQDSSGLLRGGRRHRRGGARQAREARQPRALRQRHRLLIDRARPRCVEIRSGRTVARHPREQRLKERPATGDRSRQAREPHRAAARAAARRPFRPGDGRHAQDHRRPDGGMARDRRLRRLHRAVPVPARRARRFRRQGGAGIAAARPIPARIPRQDLARKP